MDRITRQLDKIGASGKDVEDPLADEMGKSVKSLLHGSRELLDQYEKTVKAWEEFNKEQIKLSEVAANVFQKDSSLKKKSILSTMDDFEEVIGTITEEVPAELKKVMDDKLGLADSLKSLEDANASLKKLKESRKDYEHYMKKMGQLSEDAKKKSNLADKVDRNLEKLKNAQEEYETQRDEIGEELDSVLNGGKRDYLKHVVMIMRWQSGIYKKSAKVATQLDAIIEAAAEQVSNEDSRYWDEMSYEDLKTEMLEEDDVVTRAKDIIESESGRGRKKKKKKKKGSDDSDEDSEEEGAPGRRRRSRRGKKDDDSDDSEVMGKSPTKKKDSSRRKKKDDSSDDEDSPASRRRGGGKKKAKESSDEDSESGDDIDVKAIPEEHKSALIENPKKLTDFFDKKYGRGAAALVIKQSKSKSTSRSSEDNIFALDAPEPKAMIVNGREVDPTHIATLKQNPGMADKFDQKYGAGAAKQILGNGTETNAFDDALMW